MDIIISGLRASLFAAALFFCVSWVNMVLGFAQRIRARIRPSSQQVFCAFIALVALGSMSFTGHRLYEAIFNDRSPAGTVGGWDAFWLLIGLAQMTIGFTGAAYAKASGTGRMRFAVGGTIAVVAAGLLYAALGAMMR